MQPLGAVESSIGSRATLVCRAHCGSVIKAASRHCARSTGTRTDCQFLKYQYNTTPTARGSINTTTPLRNMCVPLHLFVCDIRDSSGHARGGGGAPKRPHHKKKIYAHATSGDCAGVARAAICVGAAHA